MALPLTVIVLISMCKDAYEDYKRHKADTQENQKLVKVYNAKENAFVDTQWQSLKVGQVIKLFENEYLPADILSVHSSDTKGGRCYVETKGLDGETNLKIKYV